MAERSSGAEWGVSGLAQLFDVALSAAGRQSELSEADRVHFAETGAAAFAAGMSLSQLISTYFGGAGEVWEHAFTDAEPAGAVELSRALRRVSEQAVSSLAEGFESAQRLSIRAEESLRRTFLDDLLSPALDPVRLADVAAQLQLPAFDHAAVAVAGSDRSFTDAGPVQRRVQAEFDSLGPTRHMQVTTKDGMIVVIALGVSPSDLCTLASRAFGVVTDSVCIMRS